MYLDGRMAGSTCITVLARTRQCTVSGSLYIGGDVQILCIFGEMYRLGIHYGVTSQGPWCGDRLVTSCQHAM